MWLDISPAFKIHWRKVLKVLKVLKTLGLSPNHCPCSQISEVGLTLLSSPFLFCLPSLSPNSLLPASSPWQIPACPHWLTLRCRGLWVAAGLPVVVAGRRGGWAGFLGARGWLVQMALRWQTQCEVGCLPLNSNIHIKGTLSTLWSFYCFVQFCIIDHLFLLAIIAFRHVATACQIRINGKTDGS